MANIREKNFEKIYMDTYNNVLKFVIIKSSNMDDINEIVQDTYVELYEKMKRMKSVNVDNIEAYICGIASNIIKRRYVRKKKNIILEEYNENFETDSDIHIEDDFINKDNVEKVWNYLKEKDSLTLKIFYLYFVSDLKILDISNQLGITESNVKHKIYRTIQELKNRKDVIGYEE